MVVLFVCGCSRDEVATSAPVSVPSGYERLSDVPEDATVICIGGDRISKKDYRDYLDMMVALYKNRHPSVKKEKLNSVRSRMRMSAVNEIVSRVSLRNYCRGTNAAKADEALRKELERNYLKIFARPKQNFEDLKDAMYAAGKGECFSRAFEDDLGIQAALRHSYSNELAVTAEQLQYAKARMVKYNANATATNALIMANIAIVTNRLAHGADFAKLADQYSMGEDKPGGVMGVCDLDDFSQESDDYRKAVSALRPGQVTHVLETATTYEILKAEPVVDADKSSDGSAVWNLRRIQFQKPYFLDEMDDGELTEVIAKNNRDKLLLKLAPAIREKCKVTFPSGQKIFDLGGKKKPGFLKRNKEVNNE